MLNVLNAQFIWNKSKKVLSFLSYYMDIYKESPNGKTWNVNFKQTNVNDRKILAHMR